MADNVFTYFNAVFVVLALCLVLVRASILNLSFLVVVIVNTIIGIVQELKSKKTLDGIGNSPNAPGCGDPRREKADHSGGGTGTG